MVPFLSSCWLLHPLSRPQSLNNKSIFCYLLGRLFVGSVVRFIYSYRVFFKCYINTNNFQINAYIRQMLPCRVCCFAMNKAKVDGMELVVHFGYNQNMSIRIWMFWSHFIHRNIRFVPLVLRLHEIHAFHKVMFII